ncbi:hypothetical protein [Endozoicomonas sp.]|uniref:hypothetical protein n=1 Tax=Endozoicomonas sp. TaxID=1892382 RepID=UPI0028838C13|nr:hypothetical protein [Endozoicomonas sp.]
MDVGVATTNNRMGYDGDFSQVRGGRNASRVNRFLRFFSTGNCLGMQARREQGNEYVTTSDRLLKRLKDFPDIKAVVVKVLYLTNGDHNGEVEQLIAKELKIMELAVYQQLGLDDCCSDKPMFHQDSEKVEASAISQNTLTDRQTILASSECAEKNNSKMERDQLIDMSMTDEDLKKRLNNENDVSNDVGNIINILMENHEVEPFSNDCSGGENSKKMREKVEEVIERMKINCIGSAIKNKSDVQSRLHTKEKNVFDVMVQNKHDFSTVGGDISKLVKAMDVPDQYRQLASLNISWKLLLHALSYDEQSFEVRFDDLENIKDKVAYSLDSSSIKQGKDGGISKLLTRFMKEEDKDINSSGRAKGVENILTLKTAISSGKLNQIPLETGESSESVEIASSDATMLQSNEIYNFKRAILYAAYTCHKARLVGRSQEQTACLDVFAMSCIAYFFHMMVVEESEGSSSHADAAIQILKFINSIKSDSLFLSSEQEGYHFQDIHQLNKHFEECYHHQCVEPQVVIFDLFE